MVFQTSMSARVIVSRMLLIAASAAPLIGRTFSSALPASSSLDAASVPAPPVDLPPGSVLTDVRQVGDQRLVTGRVSATVDQVLEHFRTAEGFVVSRDEDEGRAGELQLFGAAGTVGVTVARLTCPRDQTGFTVSTAVTQPSPAS